MSARPARFTALLWPTREAWPYRRGDSVPTAGLARASRELADADARELERRCVLPLALPLRAFVVELDDGPEQRLVDGPWQARSELAAPGAREWVRSGPLISRADGRATGEPYTGAPPPRPEAEVLPEGLRSGPWRVARNRSGRGLCGPWSSDADHAARCRSAACWGGLAELEACGYDATAWKGAPKAVARDLAERPECAEWARLHLTRTKR